MFAFLRGLVAEVAVDRVVLDVGGVGYELFSSAHTLTRLKKGETSQLCTYMHITQDSLAVFGFLTPEEKCMFKRLISVSRVGPKVALSALSVLSAADVATAIVTGNDTALSRVPGLGKKTAQRIILELKEKIATEETFGGGFEPIAGDASANGIRQETVAALIALGYDANTATKAVAAVVSPPEKIEEYIKAALKQLVK